MGFVLRFIGALVLALALGLGSAYLAVRHGLGGEIKSGPWATSLTTGSIDADNYTRAAVAIGGLLALSKEETIYYNATTDSAGDPLNGHCTYRIEGRDPDARWWSFTVYANDNYLIDTPTRRWSVTKNNVVRAADGAFVIRLSTVQEPTNWIATSPDGFQVTLRLYHPAKTIKDDPAQELPAITKEACS